MATEVKDDEDVVDGIIELVLVLEFNVIEAVDVLLTGVLVVAVGGDGGGRAATALAVLLVLANGEDGGDELGGVGGGGCSSAGFIRVVFSRNFRDEPEGRRRMELLGNTGVWGGFSLTTILLSSSLSVKKNLKR